MRPTCINKGCTKLVVYSKKDTDGNPRWRPTCGRCHQASYGKIKPNGEKVQLAEGVTSIKTGVCCNQDERLGFPCPMDYKKAPWAFGQTEIDHINGNREHNFIKNVQELCKPCHAEKGRRNGDFKQYYK